MKYFSLSFKTEKEDYELYYRDFGKGLIMNQLRKSVISAIFTLVMIVLLITNKTVSYIVPVTFVFIITCFMPLVFSKKISMNFLNTRNSKKENRYDFYADHIEIHTIDDGKSKESIEKHLKMNGFVSVAESGTNFYFFYMNEKMLLIPKRILDAEKYGMIKNLIDNYFSDVYMTV